MVCPPCSQSPPSRLPLAPPEGIAPDVGQTPAIFLDFVTLLMSHSGGIAQTLPQGGFLDQTCDRSLERGRVSERNDDSVHIVRDHLCHAATRSGDDRKPVRHCLEQAHWQVLPEAWEYEYVRLSKQI